MIKYRKSDDFISIKLKDGLLTFEIFIIFSMQGSECDVRKSYWRAVVSGFRVFAISKSESSAESLGYRVSSKRGTGNKRRSPYQGCSIGTVPFTLLGQPRPVIGGTRQHSCVLAGLQRGERAEGRGSRGTIRKFIRTSVANRV